MAKFNGTHRPPNQTSNGLLLDAHVDVFVLRPITQSLSRKGGERMGAASVASSSGVGRDDIDAICVRRLRIERAEVLAQNSLCEEDSRTQQFCALLG